MLDCERDFVSPGPSARTNRKIHELGKRKSRRSNNEEDDETSFLSISSGARASRPAFSGHPAAPRNDALYSNSKRKRSVSKKRSMVNEDRLQQAENIVMDDDDDLLPSDQLLNQSRMSDDEKNETRMQLGCKIAAYCLGSNLSSEHLSSYLTDCIKLNLANKINKNNAFSLQLIDYMCVLMERNDKSVNDFPTMSCSLDASTRIYACRVDCVHSRVTEIATGIASVIEKSKRNNAIESSGEHSEEEGVNNLEKRSRKRKRKNVIASLESISRNSIEIGHWMHRPALQPDFTSLLSYASITQSEKCCLSLLQHNVPLVPKRKVKQPASEDKYYSIPFDLSKGCHLMSSDCGEDIKKLFGDECDNNNHLVMNHDGSSQPDETVDSIISNQNSNHTKEVVNDWASMIDFEECAAQEQLLQNSVCNNDDSDSSEEDVKIKLEEIVEFKKKRRRQDTLSLVNARALQAADESVYTYFDSDFLPDLWAGPEYWKPKFNRHKPTRMAGKAPEKTKKKNTRNDLLSFEDLSDVDLEFDKSQVQSKLEKQVMLKWSESSLMKPLRKDYKVKDLFCSFLRKTLFFKPYLKKEEDTDKVKVEVEYVDNGEPLFDDFEKLRGIYDYESVEDYYSECNEPLSPGAKDPEPTDEEQAYIETNFNKEHLVTRPNIVQHDKITYATVPKKLDMKMLKNKVWRLLDFDAKEKDRNIFEKSCIANSHGEVLFSNIYKHLPNYLPDDVWNDTSPALVFLALLHLANEKTLKLKSVNSMSDIRVEKDYLDGSNFGS